jgi:hypothetical protein
MNRAPWQVGVSVAAARVGRAHSVGVGVAMTALITCGVFIAASPSASASARPTAAVHVTGAAAGLVHHAMTFSLATTLRGGDKVKSYVVNYGDRSRRIERSGKPPAAVRHTYTRTGVFSVSVTLRDVHGKATTSVHQLTIDPPTGTFDFYTYAARIPRSYQAGPFIDERGKPKGGDNVTPLTKRSVYVGCPGFAGPEHTSDGGVKPDIYINRGKAFTDPANVRIPAHSIFAHPGVAAKYSPTVRFANPSGRAEKFTARATITSLDGGGGDGVAGYLYQTSGGKIVNAASNDGAVSNAPPAGTTPSQTFKLSGTLPAHGSIYVVVGNNGTYNYDSAGVAFSVTLG